MKDNDVDMKNIALLPNETIRVGEVTVKKINSDEDEKKYLFFLNDFKIARMPIRKEKDFYKQDPSKGRRQSTY